jgi:cytochrome P450
VGQVPWLGDLWRFFDDRLSFLERCARAGDVTSVRLGPFRTIVLSHPEHVREVFVREAKHFNRGITAAPMRLLLGQGLLLSEGDTWKRQRKDVQPLFGADQAATWHPQIEAAAAALVSRWRDGGTRDIHHEMHRLTLDIAARIFFGVAGDERGNLHPALEAVLREDVFTAVGSLGPLRWPPRAGRALRGIEALVAERIDRASDDPGSFLAALARVSRDRRELRDHIVTFLFTAEDTTAVALTWLWHLLARHPRAEAELRAAIADPEGGAAHVRRAVDETLRLYPPVIGQARQAVDDCEIGGMRVGRRDLVLFSQWIIQRDARWFDEPLAFKPERWRDGFEDELHPFVFFPFGGGRRVCIGRALATTIALTVVPFVARRYRLVATSDLEPALHTVISPRPRDGLPMTIRRVKPN